ncbi:acyltransferase [Novosphingobium sp. B-7]|uniref:acyltransferase family protein n=1 Tax=Novosphingobium sp. B-7 TaxID=1298855 RepID=UPI0009E5E220|nr:acyltransferase [Novosphingobium sp. B-7]
MSKGLSSFFDASRWIAALMVLIYHVRLLILLSPNQTEVRGVLFKLIYFVTGFGHAAVMIFFVISGYLVGGLTVTRLPERGFHLARFAAHRASRIYTVLIPALVLGGLLDLIGLRFLNQDAIYNAGATSPIASLQFVVADNLNIRTFLGNILMLQTLDGSIVHVFGSNGPLWSLAYEWWYYCLFAAVMVAATRRHVVARVVGAVVFVVIITNLPHEIIMLAPIWFMGIMACLYNRSNLWKPPFWLGLVIMFSVLTYVRIQHPSTGASGGSQLVFAFNDFIVGLGFAIATVACSNRQRPLAFGVLHRTLADFSYSTYLFHFPMVLFAVAVAKVVFGIPFAQRPNLLSIGWLFFLVVIILSACFFLSRFTERKTNAIRDKLLSCL